MFHRLEADPGLSKYPSVWGAFQNLSTASAVREMGPGKPRDQLEGIIRKLVGL
jgi:hypothetical protein